ncbi:hypothetical protein VPH35_112451 [Triticum aestivum]
MITFRLGFPERRYRLSGQRPDPADGAVGRSWPSDRDPIPRLPWRVICVRTHAHGAHSGRGRESKEQPSGIISLHPTGAALRTADGNGQRRAGRSARRGAMGKYMRKCRAEDGVGGVEVTQAVGVRTRSRAAAANVVVSKRRRPLPPSSPLGGAAARAQSGSCYLKLRSRMLFMAPPAPASAAGPGHGPAPPLPAGLSRCSSTASSVDASAAGQDRSLPSCGSDAAANSKAGAPEGSASNNAESGGNRERRETTPSSHFPGDLSDLESDLAGQNSGRSSLPQTPTAQVQPAARSRIPPAAEIEEFFAAAEEAEARRFACK